MPQDNIHVEHDGLRSLLDRAKEINERAKAAGDIDPNIDPAVRQKLEEESKATAKESDDSSDTMTYTDKASQDTEAMNDDAAAQLDKVGSDSGASGTGDVATHTTAADSGPGATGAGSDAALRSQADAAADQAMQQNQARSAAEQMAAQQAQQQQMAAQQAAQYQQAQQQQSMAMQQAQLSAQQQAAWQQAMQQQQAQAQMNQMNMEAQQQALTQVGHTNSDQVTAADVRAILDGLYADDSSHVEGTTDSSIQTSGTEVETDDLGGAANVSLEHTYPDGALSDQEIEQIIDKACDLNGVSEDPAVRDAFKTVWSHMAANESGGNPNAANGWDTNAVGPTQSDGYPAQSSRGIWQCIPETFSANHVAGTSNSIYDPLASCAASIRYTMQRYGVSPDGSGLQEFAANRGIDASTGQVTGSYLGY